MPAHAPARANIGPDPHALWFRLRLNHRLLCSHLLPQVEAGANATRSSVWQHNSLGLSDKRNPRARTHPHTTCTRRSVCKHPAPLLGTTASRRRVTSTGDVMATRRSAWQHNSLGLSNMRNSRSRTQTDSAAGGDGVPPSSNLHGDVMATRSSAWQHSSLGLSE